MTLRIWPLPVRRINGIGPKAGARLEALGVRTIGELAACERDVLVRHFGRGGGSWLADAAAGRDDRPLVTSGDAVSMSRETTFDRDLSASADRAALGTILDDLVHELAHDLQRKGYLGRTVGIKLRFEDFKTVTRDLTLASPTAEADTIRHAAGLCLKRVDFSRRIRLMGVRMASLSHAGR
jgi:DNA polymerase IV